MLQGSVTEFTLTAQSKQRNVTEVYPPGTSEAIITNLIPNTAYTVRLTITVHGGETITSLPVTGKTLDGGSVGIECIMYIFIHHMIGSLCSYIKPF